MLTTFTTIVGEPLMPIFSVPSPISSIPKVVIFSFLAKIAPLNYGFRGGIPVGVKEMTHGIGNLSI
jgi:hypothetical protein